MSKRAVLGKVATEAYQEYLDYLEANAKDLEKLGLQEFRLFFKISDVKCKVPLG